MKKTQNPKKLRKKSPTNPIDPVPKFYRISQVTQSGKLIPLFPKPLFCTQSKGLELGLGKHTPDGNLVTIKVKLLNLEEQGLMFLKSTEIDLTKYTKEQTNE